MKKKLEILLLKIKLNCEGKSKMKEKLLKFFKKIEENMNKKATWCAVKSYMRKITI